MKKISIILMIALVAMTGLFAGEAELTVVETEEVMPADSVVENVDEECLVPFIDGDFIKRFESSIDILSAGDYSSDVLVKILDFEDPAEAEAFRIYYDSFVELYRTNAEFKELLDSVHEYSVLLADSYFAWLNAGIEG